MGYRCEAIHTVGIGIGDLKTVRSVPASSDDGLDFLPTFGNGRWRRSSTKACLSPTWPSKANDGLTMILAGESAAKRSRCRWPCHCARDPLLPTGCCLGSPICFRKRI